MVKPNQNIFKNYKEMYLINSYRNSAPIIETPYKLNFNVAFKEYITMDGPIVFGSLPFEMEFNFLYTSVDSTYLSLMAGGSVDRILVRTTGFIFNFGNSTLYTKTDSVPYGILHNLKVKRDVLNDMYYSLNGGAWIFIKNEASVGCGVRVIGSALDGSVRYLNGYLTSFRVDSSIWNLNEGAGVVVTSSDGKTATYNTLGDLTHVNTVSWELI